MKIINKFFLTSLIVFFISNTSLAQTDTTEADSNKFSFNPQFSGAHVEACFFPPPGIEVGALVDIDLFRIKKTQLFSLGFRISFEYFWIGNPGGGEGHKYFDYCLYARPSLKFNWFWINVLGGFAYHTNNKTSGNMESKLASRFGLELKFNVFRKYIGLLLKSSFSPEQEEGFIGIGISVGYFN